MVATASSNDGNLPPRMIDKLSNDAWRIANGEML